MNRATESLLFSMLLAMALPVDTGAQPADHRFSREVNLDRSGNDIRSVKLPEGSPVEACEDVCAATTGCVAFTFVKESTTVPQPICWLKDTVPTGYPSSCCTSGIKRR